MPRRLLLAPLAVALFAAGCGGASPSDQPSHQARIAPRTDGLRVTATDLRLGTAALGTPQGLERLSLRQVPRQQAQREGIGAGASCPDQDLLPDGTNTAAVVASTLCLLNGERADAGLPPLASDAALAAAALEHSRDMVANQYFSHTALDGRDIVDRLRATHYIPAHGVWTVGENLAWGTGTLSTPRSIVDAWMHSEGHRENILRAAFDQIGFGVVTGTPASRDGAGATYTTTFGSLGASRSATSSSAGTPVASTPKPRPAAKRHHASSARHRARVAHRRAVRMHARAARAARI